MHNHRQTVDERHLRRNRRSKSRKVCEAESVPLGTERRDSRERSVTLPGPILEETVGVYQNHKPE